MGKRRLDFLDFLRFLAAFSVLFQHAGERLFPWFRFVCTNYFQFGVFGVTLFFLCSGFIIPVSLEKSGSLKRFWISRFFRLFPLYYTSIVVTLFFIYIGFLKIPYPSIKALFWNAIMLMKFVGQPSILGLYWTLSLEMLFYILVSILFLLKLLQKTLTLSIFALSVCILFAVLGANGVNVLTKGWGTFFYLATMFTGSVFYKNNIGELSNRSLMICVLFAATTTFLNTYLNLYGKVEPPEALGSLSFIPVTNGILFAYIIFFIFYRFRHLTYPSLCVHLGVISYSLYLVQETVYSIVPEIPNSPKFTLFVWIFLIISISNFTYKCIEEPFLNLGNKVKSRL